MRAGILKGLLISKENTGVQNAGIKSVRGASNKEKEVATIL